MSLVHRAERTSGLGEQDVRIVCDESWTAPAWPRDADSVAADDQGVHLAEDGRWYTFEKAHVTCPACVRLDAT